MRAFFCVNVFGNSFLILSSPLFGSSLNKHFFTFNLFVCVGGGCMHVALCTFEGQRTTFSRLFSLPVTWAAGMAASVYFRAILLAPHLIFLEGHHYFNNF